MLIAMSSQRAKGLHVLRSLYRELRPAVNEPEKHVYQTQVWKYIIKECRRCGDDRSNGDELSRNLIRSGEYYIDSVRGTREYLRIFNMYKGKGERTPRDLAAILGFRMPDEPRVPRLPKVNKSSEDSQEKT